MGIGVVSWIAFFVWALSEIAIVIQTRRLRRNVSASKMDKGSAWLIRIAIYLGVGIAFAFHSFGWGRVGWPVADVTAVLLLASVALRLWSVHLLGRNFSPEVSVDSGQELIKSGPYRLIRHPAYTGLLLTFAFLGLAFRSWVASCAILLLLVPCFLYRIRIEEAALKSSFGPAYEEYCRTTWRLLPYLW